MFAGSSSSPVWEFVANLARSSLVFGLIFLSTLCILSTVLRLLASSGISSLVLFEGMAAAP